MSTLTIQEAPTPALIRELKRRAREEEDAQARRALSKKGRRS